MFGFREKRKENKKCAPLRGARDLFLSFRFFSVYVAFVFVQLRLDKSDKVYIFDCKISRKDRYRQEYRAHYRAEDVYQILQPAFAEYILERVADIPDHLVDESGEGRARSYRYAQDKSKEKGDSQYRAVSTYGYREHVFDLSFKGSRRRAHKHYSRRHRYYYDYISGDKIGYIAYVSKPYVCARRLGESEQPPHVETRRDCYHYRLNQLLLVFRRHSFLPSRVLNAHIFIIHNV